ncbi:MULTISPECIES: gas vesicle protein [unclassified Nocardiopsis]|uniref:gas vesicle protein n=1 Tax=Nocardiopsis TaxID=2013 RepID=UPI00387A9EAF
MSEPVPWQRTRDGRNLAAPSSPASLADVLERVLDKGIVIAGDIQINLLDIELLTIKLRLLVASVDKAKEMGIDWWEHDPALSSKARDRDDDELAEENRRLRERIEQLEGRAEVDAGDRDESGDGGDRSGERSKTGGEDA